jgi:4-amino-4-deoxy-L-arabinose transferase-like glycosyltransferase
MKKLTLFIFAAILILAAVLRFYKLDKAPPSLSWDEAAVGYNAWTILNWGKDEWGKTMPLVFKSFEDYKHPVHVYLTVPFIAIFGLNEIGVRASSAFFGVVNVAIIYFLARKIFKSDLAALLSALFLTISPYSLQFSRFNHELNFALFFFMLGIYWILTGIEKKNYLLILGFGSLGIDLLTYHSALAVVPPILILIIILNFKDLWKIKKYFLSSIAVLLLFTSLFFVEPQLLGLARLDQTSSSKDRTLQAIETKYLTHFSTDFLFLKGDSNARLSSQTGSFYKIDALFLAVGVLAMFWGIVKKKKEYLIIIAWALLAPIPASVTSEVPHAARAMFLMGSMNLIAAQGACTIICLFKQKSWRILTGVVIVAILGVSFYKYSQNYYEVYANRYAIEWQYGMKQVVEYVKAHPEYDEVYMTAERQEPYIFYLFYFKTPLPLYLSTVKFNETPSRPANTVVGYSKFHFGLWDPIESQPIPHVLYVVTPSDYTGLRYKLSFETVYAVKYPSGSDAFFLVTARSTFDQ